MFNEKDDEEMNLLSKTQALNFMRSNMAQYIAIAATIRPHVQAGKFAFYCNFCNEVVHCKEDKDWNMRNSIFCSVCNLGGRERHAFKIIETLIESGNYPNRAILEEVTRFKRALDQHFSGFLGSEYLGPSKHSGGLYDYEGKMIVHQDIANLSYSSDSLDMIVTMDVLEHVPDIPIALRELNRVLRLGGVHVMTVPFYDQRNSVKRAEIINNELVNIHPASFHGNPVSEQGALVFTEPGIDLLDIIEASGFDIRISIGANTECGLLPDGNSTPSFNSWNLVFLLTKIAE